jgi:hypothetical protein
MRTTVTLDSDVRRGLEEVMKERGISFKRAINDTIRAGLAPSLAASRQRNRRFVQKTYSMGAAQHFPRDKALAAADAIEDAELVRKLELGKRRSRA